jgi:hypothetical protein
MQEVTGKKASSMIGLALIVVAACLPSTAYAAPSLAEVQAKVRDLEEDATAAAEGAQEAKVKLASLQKQLAGIQAAEAVQWQKQLQNREATHVR